MPSITMAPGIEMSDISWLALLAAIASNIVLGFLWYSPMLPTGRTWMREMNLPLDHKPDGKKMAQSMTLMVVGTFLLMFVFLHTNLAYRDAFRLDGARLDAGGLTIADGLTGGFFTWLGFFLPQGFTSVGFENKSWTLFRVNQGYHLLSLLVAGTIIALLV